MLSALPSLLEPHVLHFTCPRAPPRPRYALFNTLFVHTFSNMSNNTCTSSRVCSSYYTGSAPQLLASSLSGRVDFSYYYYCACSITPSGSSRTCYRASAYSAQKVRPFAKSWNEPHILSLRRRLAWSSRVKKNATCALFALHALHKRLQYRD